MRAEGGFRAIGALAAAAVARVALQRTEGAMSGREARAALVELAVAAVAVADNPWVLAELRGRAQAVADALALDADDALMPLRNACWAWAADARAFGRVRGAVARLYLSRVERHAAPVAG